MYFFSNTARERVESQYWNLVTTMYGEVFPDSLRYASSDHMNWDNWVSRGRDFHDLVHLIASDDVETFMKARALAVLCAPEIALAPYFWLNKKPEPYLKYVEQFPDLGIKKFSNDLKEFLGKLIIINSVFVHEYRQKLKQSVRVRDSYNAIILELLACDNVEPNLKEDLFAWYELEDAVPDADYFDPSGYRPFSRLLQSNISNPFKERAREDMEKLVKKELSGNSKPRKSWERVLRGYMNAVHESHNSVSRNFLMSQIRFLMDIRRFGVELKFETTAALGILRRLDDYKGSFTFTRFLQHVFMCQESLIRVHAQIDADFLTKLISGHYVADSFLSGVIKAVLDKHEPKSVAA